MMKKEVEIIEGNTSMPTSTEVKVRTPKVTASRTSRMNSQAVLPSAGNLNSGDGEHSLEQTTSRMTS